MKIIASDFDNTLYVKDDLQLMENIESVAKFISSGNIFIIITGRSFTNIKKVLNEKNIPYSFLVCQDGANIFDSNDNCLKSNLLDSKKAEIIEDYLKTVNLDYSFESAFNDNDILENAVKITITLHGNEDAKSILNIIKNKTQVSFYGYVSSKHINIIDDYVDKSNALMYMINNKIIGKNILAIGDDINDYEMLSHFDGVIMEKHDPILDKLNKSTVKSLSYFIEKKL